MAESTSDRETRFRRALADFQAGRFLHARLAWKAMWDEEDDETHRTFLQALLVVASAMEKRAVDAEATRRLLALAIPKVESLPDAFGGVDLAGLRTSLARVAAGEAESVEIAETGTPVAWGRARPKSPTIELAARPAHFRKALAAYGAARYFEAHELWEDLWRDEPDPRHKNFLQALIQVAAAMHKLLVMGGTKGAIHLLGRAILRLEGVPDGYAGVRVARLVDDCRRAQAEVERLAGEGRTDLAAVPRIEGME